MNCISLPLFHTVSRWAPRGAGDYTGLLISRGVVIGNIARRIIRMLCDQAGDRQAEIAMESASQTDLRVLPIADMPAHCNEGVAAVGLYQYATAQFPVSLIHPFLVIEMLVCRIEPLPFGRIYAAMDPIAIDSYRDCIFAISRTKRDVLLEAVSLLQGDSTAWQMGHYAASGVPGSDVRWLAGSSWLFTVREKAPSRRLRTMEASHGN